MGYGTLEELTIFRQAERIGDRFYELVNPWRPLDQNAVGQQLIRAADSIGANIVESYGRFHYGDQLRFLYYARGSLYETKFWVRRAERRSLIAPETAHKALDVLDELATKLNSYIRSVRRQQNHSSDRLAETPATYEVSLHQDPVPDNPFSNDILGDDTLSDDTLEDASSEDISFGENLSNNDSVRF